MTTMRQFDASYLATPAALKPAQIKQIRERAHVSQPVFARYLNNGRLDRPPGKHMEFQNSSHQDNADGGILEKEEVADLVQWAQSNYIEVIPELPSLTHSYYLLSRHRELAAA